MRVNLCKNTLFVFFAAILLAGCEPFIAVQKESTPEALLPTLDTTQVLGEFAAPVTPDGNTFRVTKVVDGDTIQIEGGKTIRYIGIDTPETVDPRKTVQCFGSQASAKNKELVEGKYVRLEKDVSETDKYGRLLRYVYIDNIFVNDFLVRQGYAYAKSYPPDIKFQSQFGQAQDEALRENRGLWAGCSSTSLPSSYPPITSSSKVVEGDKDCKDFKTHAEAQAFFLSQGGPGSDPHKLDVDKDGIACESLP